MADLIFRALLRLYPREFQRRYGAEQLEFLRQEWTTSAAGTGNVFLFWFKTVWDAFGAAFRIRLGPLYGKGAKKEPGGSESGPPFRESKGGGLFEEALQDVRFALRSLRKQPSFTIVAVGVLGLGIGASTTLFSAVNGVLLRPLPYPEQDRLVFLGSKFPQGTRISGMSIPELMDVEAEIGSVGLLAGVRGRALDLVGEGEPERVAVAEVSRNYFTVLGIAPALGRGFSPEAFGSTGSGVVMVSDGLWRRKWGADPDIVGRTLRASDGRTPGFQSYTIVGVLPPDFENPPPLENPYSRLPPADIWAPLPLNGELYTTSRTNWTVRAVGRLEKGASLESLNAELGALGLSLKELYPGVHLRGDTYLGLGARSLLDEMVGSRQRDLMILLGATGLLLLIACANVAGLMVARSLDRRREMGLRTALGAGRRRLFRQLLTENLILALLGGGVGIGLAILGVKAFHALGPTDFPRMADIALDFRVLAFGLGVAGATGVLFGVGPALAGSRERGASVVTPSERGSTTGRNTLRVRRGLVVLEVALALVLLTGCGLLTRSMLLLQGRDSGIEAEHLALMQVRLLPSYDEDEERSAFFTDLQARIQALPGVVSVSHVADPPMGFNNWSPNVWTEEDAQNEAPTGMGNAHPVGLDYFKTVGIPIRRGRTFTEADDVGSPPVIIVSQTLAEALWPGEDPLGKRLGISINYDGPWVTVVGVAGDIRQNTLASEPAWDLYFPYVQRAGNAGQFMAIRTAGEPLALSRALRETVWSLDDNVPVPEITTMDARMAATLRLPRFRTLLLASFAVVALILAGAGIYGTLLYTVGRRTPEVGIRMALGAEAGDVVGLILRQGMVPVLMGLGLGLLGSVAATRVLESVLFQIAPNDPLTFVLVAGTLTGVCLLAAYLPARRASRVDPQEALRRE
jgi:putative ABC transport system permease protein